MDSDVPYLHSDIIKNILKRLPAKSLIRFRSVCKDWKILLKNSSFIADHLQQQSCHQIPSLLFECNHQPWRCCLHLLDSELQVRKVHSVPRFKGARIVGSCNGLLCVEINQRIPSLLSLWNPATSAIRDLPQGIFLDRFRRVTGFGFSPVVNDYKIVRIYSPYGDETPRIYAPYDDETPRVEVFSLNTGSWRGMSIENLKKVSFKSNSSHVSANGAIFWLGAKRGVRQEGPYYLVVDDVKVVVSFDIAQEVFTVIPMPNLEDHRNAMLSVYDNKVAIVSDVRVQGSPDLVDLWVFDEDTCESGTTWRRIKRYTSNISMDLTTVWSNAIVCKPSLYKEYTEEGRNVLYIINLTTNEFKRLVIPYCGPVKRVYNHMESIVSVWPWNGFLYYDIERELPH
ncbi:hypothetical protein QN277_009157 [Acacia crassicarpa]|uniref:F-box domain-containing protein n=1 Tax=Acacia crassicarpa TaxID=499986 RepID=A0AAE1IS15_9FABA|nr:hypothetical protein QN277_009157 [Acacia crassicarpa]